MMRVYRDRKVYSIFGLSLTEFLELTPEICDHILTLCMDQQIAEVETQEKVMKEINTQSNQTK
jgi:hypothetical protein